MTADELVDNLRGQIDPDIKDTVLISIILERILQILLDSLDHFLGSLEVVDVPLVIGLALILIANGAIGKQMIEKLNRQNVDGVEIFQCWNVDVLAFCDVQEDTVDEEQEGLNVQMLAPTEAEVEEKLA